MMDNARYRTLVDMRSSGGEEWSLPKGSISTGAVDVDGAYRWVEFPGGVCFEESDMLHGIALGAGSFEIVVIVPAPSADEDKEDGG